MAQEQKTGLVSHRHPNSAPRYYGPQIESINSSVTTIQSGIKGVFTHDWPNVQPLPRSLDLTFHGPANHLIHR